MINSGFWTFARYGGAPIRVHWTVAFLVLFFGGWRPGAWVGIVFLVLMHELGHAAIVRAVRAQVTEVMVYGFGGYCGWRGHVGPRGRALIAWGGVFAQAIVLVIAWSVRSAMPVQGPFMAALLYALIEANISLIVINLIPIPPLDGASAWPLVPILRDDFMRWWNQKRKPAVHARPAKKPDDRSSEPEQGPPSSRVTDPVEADRVFERVFKGLVDMPIDAEPEDDSDDDATDRSNKRKRSPSPDDDNGAK